MKNRSRKLEIKSYYSPDINNLWAWQPEANSALYLLEMDIGLVGEDASDLYSVIVATPERIANIKESGLWFGTIHRMLLLKIYSWRDVQNTINQVLLDLNGHEDSLSIELSRHFMWEYEGMK